MKKITSKVFLTIVTQLLREAEYTRTLTEDEKLLKKIANEERVK